jgi:hypothetical protein
MREPRAFRPGVPELTAHIRHLNRVHTVSSTTGRLGCRGMGVPHG